MSVAKTIAKFVRSSSGATAIEYGLIASVIVLGVIAGASLIGEETTTPFERVSAAIASGNKTGG